MNPDGHLQTALWFCGSQSAVTAQGLPTAQGFTQRLFKHASVNAQSLLLLQPSSISVKNQQRM